MPTFSKSPPELVKRFHAVTAEIPDVDRRLMFGYPSLFIGGNLITGLFAANWFVRLGDSDRDALLKVPGAGPFEVMPGRAMGGYLLLPPATVADDAALRDWLDRAVELGRTLPPKAPKRSKGAKASKASRSTRA